MNGELFSQLTLANYTGKNHKLITRKQAEAALVGTEFENYHRMRGVPDKSFPENYFFTFSSFEHVESHVRCGTPFSINAFFLNDERDGTLSLFSIPIAKQLNQS